MVLSPSAYDITTKVFFCDIAGFTAWSSTREPSQVFILLQSVYQAFDAQAKRRKVFKVETIGDSYMVRKCLVLKIRFPPFSFCSYDLAMPSTGNFQAVTGLPEPMENHAVTMVRFSWDCLHKMRDVVEALELSLGPGTGDLSIRVGLHSGKRNSRRVLLVKFLYELMWSLCPLLFHVLKAL